MIVDFSSLNCMESPTLVLQNLDGTPLQTLGFAFDVGVELSYNEVSTLTFSLPGYVDGEKTPHYDDVVGMRIIDLVGCGRFLLVDPQEEIDGPRQMKSCKGYSLEYEFTKKNIYLEAGTYNFFSGIGTNDNTIIGRIRERMPDWSYDVDTALIGKYRTFDDTNKKIYEFIKSDLQQAYGCIFDFDTYTKTVHVRSVDSNVPTKQVYLSQNALIKKLQIDEDSDSVVTCLDVNGADGVNIRSVNPTGTNKIYNLDYFLTETNFSTELIQRWRAWEQACDDARDEYYQTTISYNMKLLEILTEQAALTDLETEYTSLDNVRAVIIQGISQGIKTQADLDEVNAQLASKQAEIDDISVLIEDLKAQAVELNSYREDVNARLSFDYMEDDQYVWFTPGEVEILSKYFFEDIIEDSSFVAQTVEAYDEEDMSTSVVNQLVGINSQYTSAEQAGYIYYSFRGGSVSLSSLNANIIKGTLSYNQEAHSIVFTAYLDGGTIGDTPFTSGNLTLMGNATVSGSSAGSSMSFTVSDGRFYFTKNSTEYEKNQIEWELFEYGKQVLREHASPTYNFTVDCANFLAIDRYLAFQRQLKLGERIYLNIGTQMLANTPLDYYDANESVDIDDSTLKKLDWFKTDEALEPYVVSVHLKYGDPSSFSIEFSSSYNSFDHSFSIAKLLDQSVSMGKSLNYKSGMYSSFVNSGASTSVKKFMESALDIAKNRVLSSGNQAITFDDTGIRVRMWADDSHQNYEPEEIWLVNNMMVFTDDNWDTAKLAIGKIFDQNLITYKLTEDTQRDPDKTYYIDDEGTEWTGSPAWSRALYEKDNDGNVYGIAAPYIVGTLLAGENLVIQGTKPDGEHMSFTVDSKGASLYNANFEVADDNRQIVLSPKHGIVVGKNPSVVIDVTTGEEQLNEANAKFWVDTNGNVHFAGTLDGADGIFTGSIKVGGTASDPNFYVDTNGNVFAKNGTFDGVVRAKALYVAGQNILSNTSTGADGVEYATPYDSTNPDAAHSQIESQYLSLYGLKILDPNPIDPTDPASPHAVKMTIDGSTGDVHIGNGTYYGGQYFSTGLGREGGAAFYICYGFTDGDGSRQYYDYVEGRRPRKLGYISYDALDTPDSPSSAKYRMLIKSENAYHISDPIYGDYNRGLPIKIEAVGDISLQAGVGADPSWELADGVIYLASPSCYLSNSFGNTLPQTARSGQLYYVVPSGSSGWTQATPYVYV